MKIFKKKWVQVLCIALICLLGFAILGGTAFAIKESKTISATAFSRGALDENGKYVACDSSIYTKAAFECKGLRVEPDFESSLTYDVYYYDYNDKLVGTKTGLVDVYDEDYPLAKTARIVIHPSVPDDVDADDYKIGYLEVYGIAKDVKITVDKNQTYLYSNSINEFDAAGVKDGYSFTSYDKGVTLLLSEADNLKVSNEISLNEDYNKYDIYVKSTDVSNLRVVAVAVDENDVVLYSTSMSLASVAEGDWCKLTINLKDIKGDAAAETILVSMPSGSECYVFGYNN